MDYASILTKTSSSSSTSSSSFSSSSASSSSSSSSTSSSSSKHATPFFKPPSIPLSHTLPHNLINKPLLPSSSLDKSQYSELTEMLLEEKVCIHCSHGYRNLDNQVAKDRLPCLMHVEKRKDGLYACCQYNRDKPYDKTGRHPVHLNYPASGCTRTIHTSNVANRNLINKGEFVIRINKEFVDAGAVVYHPSRLLPELTDDEYYYYTAYGDVGEFAFWRPKKRII